MWYPGHIAKTKNSIIKNLKLINAVIEIVDSRAPYSSRAYEYGKLFRDKKKIIIFNKSDICDEKITKKWIELYKSKQYDVYLTSLKKVNVNKFIMNKIMPKIPVKFGEKTAMIVGVPNTGKSTFINSLKRKKTTNTGNTPGLTRGIQWINISDRIKVMDTPGILFPELYNENIINKLIIIGSLKHEDIETEKAIKFAYDYMKKNYFDILNKIIEINDITSINEFIEKYAIKNNYIIKGAKPNLDRARKDLIFKISNGEFGLMTFDKIEDFEDIKI